MIKSIIGASGQIASSTIGAISADILAKKERNWNTEQAKINRDFQREERELSQEFNLDMWNRTNEYNSLSSQIERAKEAGVSPNAILGSSVGTIASNPVTTSPMSGTPTSPGGSIASSVGQNLSNIGLHSAEIIKTLAEKKNLESDSQLNELEIAYNNATFESRVNEAKSRVDNIVESTNKLIAETNKTHAEEDKIKADKAVVDATLPFICQKNKADLDIAIETSNKIREETNQLKLNGKSQRWLNYSQQKVNEKNVELLGVSGEIAEETKDEQIANAEYESAMLKLRKEFSDSWGMPLDTPEFAFMWKLNKDGLLEGYLDNVVSKTVQTQSYSDSKGKTQNHYEIEGIKTFIELLMLLASKGKINPKTTIPL